MSENDLPQTTQNEFDVILLGTNLMASILSGALSKDQKRVLHLDKNDYYGEECCGALPVREWLLLMTRLASDPQASPLSQVEFHMQEESSPSSQDDIQFKWCDDDLLDKILGHLPNGEHHRDSVEKTVGALHRSTCVDFNPQLLHSRGRFIDLLANTNMGQYLEFKKLDDFQFWRENPETRQLELKDVPGSKEEVFMDSSISLLDKRRLMKFLTSLLDSEKLNALLEDHANTSFREFLGQVCGLNDGLCRVVGIALAMMPSESAYYQIGAKEGVERVIKYIKSIGRYGKTGYIWNEYGMGSELSQAFCRFSAVHGGTFMLKSQVQSIERVELGNGMRFKLITKEGDQIHTFYGANLLVSPCYLNLLSQVAVMPHVTTTRVYRAVGLSSTEIEPMTLTLTDPIVWQVSLPLRHYLSWSPLAPIRGFSVRWQHDLITTTAGPDRGVYYISDTLPWSILDDYVDQAELICKDLNSQFYSQ